MLTWQNYSQRLLRLETSNEVVVSLIDLGYNEWEWFQEMALAEVDDLKKSDGKGGSVSCMQLHRKRIERFLLYINSKKQENDPNSPWKDIASYAKDEFKAFDPTASANATTPPQPGKKNVADEKALESWIRRKR